MNYTLDVAVISDASSLASIAISTSQPHDQGGLSLEQRLEAAASMFAKNISTYNETYIIARSTEGQNAIGYMWLIHHGKEWRPENDVLSDELQKQPAAVYRHKIRTCIRSLRIKIMLGTEHLC